ncbi:BPSS1780 family membrane protein [Nitrosomonas sp. Is37]|uniref:BPSS1780 family membrane protein n=1 Tax=Nitrosomonas sp. Is37 TaxID=3080535 RepID=UPI00294AD905|nr:BPSS1780 family membrane protein [Nitrosomonas sp. Is37]MDV6343352.1 BPSS1780 family membrane protein [Nitrosomonas sp. Is37]
MIEARQVRGREGLQWILSGFYLFRLSPFVWILLCFTLILIAATLELLPLLGKFIFTLLSPVFMAGIMVGCKSLEQGDQLELGHLFLGFKKNTVPLITIGGFYLIGQVLIIGVFMMIGGNALVDMLLYGKRFGEHELMGVMDNILSASIVGLLLTVPLMMAIWFAPLLVMFENMPPFIAIRKSFFACLKNIIPFQIYAIVLIILGVLAIMPYGLGLFIYIPTVFASIYVSYQDIFHPESTVIDKEAIEKKEKEEGTEGNS